MSALIPEQLRRVEAIRDVGVAVVDVSTMPAARVEALATASKTALSIAATA